MLFFQNYLSFFLFFFFSRRRRHTRYWRDWSSDVCSSDLGSERERWHPGNTSGFRICNSPSRTILEVSSRISASEPSHQWTARGWVSSRTEFTQFATLGLNWGSEVIRCAAVAIHDSSYYSSVVRSCAIARHRHQCVGPSSGPFTELGGQFVRPMSPRNYSEAVQDPFI